MVYLTVPSRRKTAGYFTAERVCRRWEMGTAGAVIESFCGYDGSREAWQTRVRIRQRRGGLQISWRLNCEEFPAPSATMGRDFHRNSWLVGWVVGKLHQLGGGSRGQVAETAGHVNYGGKHVIYCLRTAGEEIMCRVLPESIIIYRT